jgi:microcystin-dependent protein
VVANLDYEEILGLSLQPARIVALSDDSAAFLFACAAFYQSRFNWLVGGEAPTDEEWNDIQRLIGKTEFALMNTLVGFVLPHFLGSIAGLPVLPCDGAIYNRVDYPLLYAAIKPVFQIDADTFFVPDLRNKFLYGEDEYQPMGSSGGEEYVTLDISEIPEHGHTSPPHSHSEITSIGALADLGTGAPVPSAVPSVGVTGGASITIDNAGGGQAHNNMPPYITIGFVIVAG